MPQKLSVSDWLSLSRIPLAAAFVAVYSGQNKYLYISGLCIAAIALITDFLDGYIARRTGSVSVQGNMLDGLGDKIFYISVIIVISREEYSGSILVTILVSREISLYFVRTMGADLKLSLQKYRMTSKLYAFIIRIYFLLFFIWSGNTLPQHHAFWISVAGNVFGWIAAAVGLRGVILIIREVWAKSVEQ